MKTLVAALAMSAVLFSGAAAFAGVRNADGPETPYLLPQQEEPTQYAPTPEPVQQYIPAPEPQEPNGYDLRF